MQDVPDSPLKGTVMQIDKNRPKPTKQELLSAEEIKFSSLLAKGMSATTAYRQAHPHKKKLSYAHIRRLAFELAAKDYIKSEVETSREQSAYLARLAEQRLEDILVNDSSQLRGNKVADVAMFMYDHANGKATQRVEQHTTGVTFNIDLTAQPTEE